ncbi:hypothetical protein [Jiella mangrovi]|uniref:Chemotaxis protein n=1 Tax=Jiella mangrovi TaxID=2821407 RepID=A0ABS4BKC8_9HYPH|nr:hypothetical protein [Jiella mangrovi]MBP0616641.1 hypothetical protein [Jiella mangrovi]
MRPRSDHLAWAIALVALVFVMPAHGEDAHSDAHSDAHGSSAAERVREAAEAARRGDDATAKADQASSDHQEPVSSGETKADAAAADGEGEKAHASDGHGASAAGADDDAEHAGEAHEPDAHEDAADGDGDADHGDSAEEHGEAAEHKEPPPTRGPQPYEVIRSLQFLQDQAARGNVSANRVQARLLHWYGPVFERASQKIWDDPRNQRAAALFVLSGGPPSVLRMILAKNDFPADVKPLLDGALAYVENRQTEAQTILSGLHTDEMEPGLSAQINLALAQMQEKPQPAKALERLRRVMLDGTGTLLEEAALRLAMGLAEELGEHDQADGYARLYFDRYAHSVYAGNFRAMFTQIYVGRPVEQAEKTVEIIADAVARIPIAEQLSIYLSIGRRSLIAGNMKLAGMAGTRVLAADNLTLRARQRAMLYVAASTLTERDPMVTLASLQAIDRENLHPADRKLYDAALGVLDEIRKPLMTEKMPDPKAADETLTEASLDSSVADRAAKLLDAVRSDLEETDR